MNKMLNRQRTLNDEAILRLREYILNRARGLARPSGAREIVIVYENKVFREATHPAHSKFLSSEYYEHLFNNIKSYEDFEMVEKDLRDLVGHAYSILNKLRPDLDPRDAWGFDIELLRLLEDRRKNKPIL